ncbi:MAG TPA: glycosyltransferase family 2 protein [Arenimonas sp.]|nr:glycosyltransferase family 2 protein [Arenimonas sp.]
MNHAFRCLVVIPVYNHGTAVARLVQRLCEQSQDCLLVDDGSEPGCASVLDHLAASHPTQVRLLRLSHNQGKGAAVMAGLREAGRLGYSHALQIDADGQHAVDDVPAFIAEAAAHSKAVICGCPVYDASVPKGRLYGRYLTHVWVWINTLSFEIRDSMCGFRVYPLAPTLELLDSTRIGKRMDFDSEIIVRLHWRGVPVRNRPTRVVYPEDGVSHFDVWRDNVRISRMHARLFFGMVLRLPRLLLQKWRRR